MNAPVRIIRSWLPALVLLAGCGPAPSSDVGDRPRSQPHLVATVMLERTPVAVRHERPGTLKLRRSVRILSQEEGRIATLDRYEGDRVAAGDLLVALEDDLLRAELDKAMATRAQNALDVTRLQSLAQRRAASEDELARARTALKVAEAEERLLTTRLAFTRIAAPFAGVITERLVEPGDFVTRNTHLLTLADPDSLVAEVLVSELVLPDIAVGDPVQVRIDALGDTWFDASILRIHPTLSERDRQGRVELRFAAIPAGARAGQFVRAALAARPVPRLMLPFRALRQDREGSFVWVVDGDGKAAVQRVDTGLRVGDGIEVLAGLEPGARVITRGLLGLALGKPVAEADSGEAGGG